MISATFKHAAAAPLGFPFNVKKKPKVTPIDSPVPEGVACDPIWRNTFELQLMRASPAYFAAKILRAPGNGDHPFSVAEHHLEWDRIAVTERRACIQAPRDHGKSAFFSFAYPIWQLVFGGKRRGFIFSATKDQAARLLTDIKEELESNPLLAWMLPPKSKRQKWTETTIFMQTGARIYARGYATKVRGAHPFWIVVDDGLNDEDAFSEPTRKKNIDFFFGSISNMVTPDGQIIVVGTPFHAEDLYGQLSENPAYSYRSFPAVRADGTVLWPGRYTAEHLDKKRIEIGSVKFTREFLCSPISDDMSLFPKALFQGDPTEQMHIELGGDREKWEDLGIIGFAVGVDFALSSSTGADWTVVFVLGVDVHGNRWVVDIQRHKGLPYHRQLSLINAVGRRYRPDLIYVEANQAQRIFGDELRRKTDLPIRKFITTGTGGVRRKVAKNPTGNTVTQNKNSLEGGVPALRVLLENCKLRIPRGDTASVKTTDTWISEMQSFSWVNGKLQGVGSHDDTVMAFWIANCACSQVYRSIASMDPGAEKPMTSAEYEAYIRSMTEGGDEEDTTVRLSAEENARIRESFPDFADDDDDEDDDDFDPQQGVLSFRKPPKKKRPPPAKAPVPHVPSGSAKGFSGNTPGTTYHVTNHGDGVLECTCPAFSFRGTCRHVVMAAKPPTTTAAPKKKPPPKSAPVSTKKKANLVDDDDLLDGAGLLPHQLFGA